MNPKSIETGVAPTTGRLPNFIIIGGMKCGTTSLHRYLEKHPDVFMSKKKELKFFVDAKNGTWSRGLDWYRSQFAGAGDAAVVGEATPEYTKNTVFPGVAERMSSVLPDARLLYILRDPIQRMLSHYVHLCSSGRERRSPTKALTAKGRNAYLDCSSYYLQLEPYLELYPRSRIHITTLEELQADPAKTMRSIFRFLDIDDEFFTDAFVKVYHSSTKKRRRTRVDRILERVLPTSMAKRVRSMPRFDSLLQKPVEKPTLPDSARGEIRRRLSEDVARLRELTGRDFSKWSI